eukprot:Gb_05996 [translate_table: standard]
MAKEDLKLLGLGVDWHRSFITTDINPFYDSFVRWQMRTLKNMGKIVIVKDMWKLKALEGRKVFLGATTLRPETITALNLAYQHMSKIPKKPTCLVELMGHDLIGLRVKSPLASNEVVYALPMLTILTDKGTGIVTSVPSDSSDDYMALSDLKLKALLRAKFGVKDEWVLPFEVIPIINILEFGDKSTEKVVMYSEPEKKFMSRLGDECVVVVTNQWYVTYGELEWRAKAEISSDLLKEMKQEFEYWCPFDLWVSGEFQDFSSDATRFSLADAGDAMDDANFVFETTNAAILRLTKEIGWMEGILAVEASLRQGPPSSFADWVFANEINIGIKLTEHNYNTMMFREALKTCLYDLQVGRDEYRLFCGLGGMDRDLLWQFMDVQTRLITPICPRYAEHVWKEVLKKDGFAVRVGWPAPDSTDLTL